MDEPRFRFASDWIRNLHDCTVHDEAVIQIPIFAWSMRDVSSVGSEHCLDKAGVTGSSPVRPTEKKRAPFSELFSFKIPSYHFSVLPFTTS